MFTSNTMRDVANGSDARPVPSLESSLLRFFALGIFLPLLCALVFGLLFLNRFVKKEVYSEVQNLSTVQLLIAQDARQEVERNLRFLSGVPPIQGILRARREGGADISEGSTAEQWRDRLASIFSETMNIHPEYLQVRYLDADGQEMVRVDNIDGRIERVPENELQNKSNREYFQEAIRYPRNSIFVSSTELNREGETSFPSEPYTSVVRFGIPIFDEQMGSGSPVQGLVLINVNIEVFFDQLRTVVRESTSEFNTLLDIGVFQVVDKDAYFQFVADGSDRSVLWGGPNDLATEISLYSMFDPLAVDTFLETDPGVLLVGDTLVSHQNFLIDELSQRASLVLLNTYPAREILAPVRRIQIWSIALGLLLTVSAGVVLFLLVLRVARPLRRVVQTAAHIRDGHWAVRVRDNSGLGELSILGRIINALSERILKSKEEMRQHVQTQTRHLQEKNQRIEDQREAILNILEDVADEKDRVQIARDRLNTILETLPVGVAILSVPDGNIELMNSRGEAILGSYDKTQVNIKNFADIFHLCYENGERYPGSELPPFYSMRDQSISIKDDIFVCRPDDEQISLQVMSAPVLDSEDQMQAVVVVFEDKTLQYQIDRAKTEFVSLASHQLRTPLSSINWYAEMVLTGDVGKLNADQYDYVDQIYKSSQRMVALVNDLLDVSRLELGTFAIDPEEVAIADLAENVLGEIRPLAEQHNIHLEKNYDPTIPPILLDAKLTTIILQNLISNAVKYTPEGGRVSLSIRVNDPALEIEVADTGMGIPKNQQRSIFSKLFRADNVRKTDTEGTGLGLYIIKSIVDTVGGNISFTSEEGEGTRFLVELPLSGMKRKEGSRRLGAS